MRNFLYGVVVTLAVLRDRNFFFGVCAPRPAADVGAAGPSLWRGLLGGREGHLAPGPWARLSAQGRVKAWDG